MRPRLSLKARGLQWLAQREHSRSELRRKLLAHLQKEQRAAQRSADGDDGRTAADQAPAEAHDDEHEPVDLEAQVDEALDWLEANRHLSDERFVESRLHVRSPRFGNLRIRQELAQHGVSLSVDDQQALKDSEYDRAWAVWQRKFASTAGGEFDAAALARQSRFLAARGFSPDVIRRVLRAGRGD